MTEESKSGRMKISLHANGLHSLNKATESFEGFNSSQDEILLRDTILFLHHAVELLMKQILINHSEYLIFEDLRDAAKKQRKADQLGLAVFFLEKPPRTVTFLEAISRVRAFIRADALSDQLVGDLEKLNLLRNQLEHYAIDADIEEIIQLISSIRQPLLDFFEESIPEIDFQSQSERIRDVAERPAAAHSELENEVYAILSKFNGQEVPAKLFNMKGDIVLPKFSDIRLQPAFNSHEGRVLRPDILATSILENWVVEVKGMPRAGESALFQVLSYAQASGARPWLIVFSDIGSHLRSQAKSLHVMLTGKSDLEKLRSYLE